jgi:type I restriction enzyme R subunit
MDTDYPRSRQAEARRRGGMLLREELEAKLAQFNPWLTKEAIGSVIEKLDCRPVLKS